MKKKFEITAPEQLEKAMLAAYPDLDERIEHMLPLKDELHWPDWCYLPMSASYAIVTGGADVPIAERFMANRGLNNFEKLSAIVPWRLHKTIFRFDDTLVESLTGTDIKTAEIPVELLHHMPYPCVYIEKPCGVEGCAGVFCFLEWDYRYPEATELRMHYLFDDMGMENLYFSLSNDEQMLYEQMTLDNAKLLKRVGDVTATSDANRFRACCEHVMEHINLLLYLCSDEPDTTREYEAPKRRGRGTVRVASHPDTINVGRYIGSTIRNSRIREASEATGQGGHVRPHVRRAHWHLYWTGTGRKTPRVKWVSPVFVNAAKGDNEAVIRPVKE